MNPENIRSFRHPAWALVLVSLFTLEISAAEPGSGVRPRTDVAPFGPGASSETIQLSPFEVAAAAGDTYDANNTNSVTGTTFSSIRLRSTRKSSTGHSWTNSPSRMCPKCW
jgi:hypothetical protein